MECALGLCSGSGRGVVGVLGDELAAHVAQSGSGVAFFGSVGPGADELNLHGHARADAARAEEVSGETGNDFSEGERTDITDDSFVFLDLALVDQFLQLHAGDDASQIAAFIDVGKCIVGVLVAVAPGALIGAADELNVGIVGSDLQHELLMTKGVVDNQLAAGFGQFDVGFFALGVLADVPLDHPLDIDALRSQSFRRSVLAANEVVGVAHVVLVADADQADLHGLAFAAGFIGILDIFGALGVARRLGVVGLTAADEERSDHCERQDQCKDLLHFR